MGSGWSCVDLLGRRLGEWLRQWLGSGCGVCWEPMSIWRNSLVRLSFHASFLKSPVFPFPSRDSVRKLRQAAITPCAPSTFDEAENVTRRQTSARQPIDGKAPKPSRGSIDGHGRDAPKRRGGQRRGTPAANGEKGNPPERRDEALTVLAAHLVWDTKEQTATRSRAATRRRGARRQGSPPRGHSCRPGGHPRGGTRRACGRAACAAHRSPRA